MQENQGPRDARDHRGPCCLRLQTVVYSRQVELQRATATPLIGRVRLQLNPRRSCLGPIFETDSTAFVTACHKSSQKPLVGGDEDAVEAVGKGQVEAIVDGMSKLQSKLEGALLERVVRIDHVHGSLLKQAEEITCGFGLEDLLFGQGPEDIRSLNTHEGRSDKIVPLESEGCVTAWLVDEPLHSNRRIDDELQTSNRSRSSRRMSVVVA